MKVDCLKKGTKENLAQMRKLEWGMQKRKRKRKEIYNVTVKTERKRYDKETKIS